MRFLYKFLLSILIFCLIAIWFLCGKNGLLNLRRLKKEKVLYQRRIEGLRRENRRLIREIEKLRSDPEYIEAVIKNELRMIRKNEVIIYFKE